MTKTVLLLAIAGAMMAGCATTPTAPAAGSKMVSQNTYRVMGGTVEAPPPVAPPVVAPVVPPIVPPIVPPLPCIDCGDPAYFEAVSASYDFRRPYLGGCGDCGLDIWRTGIPGPVTLMPICVDCLPAVPVPVPVPVAQPVPAPEPPHTKGEAPQPQPEPVHNKGGNGGTTAPTEETTTVNY